MSTHKVGYLIGSLAKGSINRKLAHALVKLAPSSLEFHEISFNDLPLYSYDYDVDYPPVAKRSRRRPTEPAQRAQLLQLAADERAGGIYPFHAWPDHRRLAKSPSTWPNLALSSPGCCPCFLGTRAGGCCSCALSRGAQKPLGEDSASPSAIPRKIPLSHRKTAP